MLNSLLDPEEGFESAAEPIYCDGCGEPFDFCVEINDEGRDVEVPEIALETANGMFCAACAAQEEE